MGLRRSRLADMFIGLLIENENLEEKLFMQNLKLKQERDEFLENDLRNISYKRILLSELISRPKCAGKWKSSSTTEAGGSDSKSGRRTGTAERWCK